MVDRSLEARNHSVVVAVVHGEITVKRLRMHGGQLWLIPENTDFPPLEITAETDFEIWGVVTHVIHSLAGG
ncbi:MAG: LexA family protein [Desulfovibrionales bacterium]